MVEEKGEKKLSDLEMTLLRPGFRRIVGVNGLGIEDPLYNVVMEDPESADIRNGIYRQKILEGRSLGVAGRPARPDDYETSKTVLRQIEEQMSMASLGEIYEAMQKMGKPFEFKLPEQTKNLSYQGIYKNAVEKKAINKEGSFDEKKLSEDEQSALIMYKEFSKFYRNVCKGSTVSEYAYKGMNEVGKAINEHYNPKPKETE
jgi:hypothetical protein